MLKEQNRTICIMFSDICTCIVIDAFIKGVGVFFTAFKNQRDLKSI